MGFQGVGVSFILLLGLRYRGRWRLGSRAQLEYPPRCQREKAKVPSKHVQDLTATRKVKGCSVGTWVWRRRGESLSWKGEEGLQQDFNSKGSTWRGKACMGLSSLILFVSFPARSVSQRLEPLNSTAMAWRLVDNTGYPSSSASTPVHFLWRHKGKHAWNAPDVTPLTLELFQHLIQQWTGC